ncbi:MAG: RPA family protein [Thermoplasmata archaeon]
MIREVAWRVFAGEYTDSTCIHSEGGERAPSYVVTPLGAKINRLLVVGVITEVENIATEEEPMWRARLSDPTGTFYLSAGQYQPEASQELSRLKPPAFVAVMGKSRVYSPDEGTIYVSIRPEMVKVVDESLRDFWVLETCKHMRERIIAMRESLEMEPVSKDGLIALGYKENLAEGIVLARRHYEYIDVERYSSMLIDALRFLLPEFREVPVAEEERPDEDAERESTVLGLIESLDKNGKGASWEDVLREAKKAGIKRDALEDVANKLLDKGLVYEPILGRMKKI